MTFVLLYSGGSYVRYEYSVYFATQQIPSGLTIDSVTLYAYVSYASLINSPIYLRVMYLIGTTWYTVSYSQLPQVTGAGQTLVTPLGNQINVGDRTRFVLRAMYTTNDSPPTDTNQFNVPISLIWLDVAVTGGIQMIV